MFVLTIDFILYFCLGEIVHETFVCYLPGMSWITWFSPFCVEVKLKILYILCVCNYCFFAYTLYSVCA